MAEKSEISVKEAKKIAKEKNLKPAEVIDTDIIQFTKGNNPRLEEISWEKFEEKIEEKDLSIIEYKGFMKIRE